MMSPPIDIASAISESKTKIDATRAQAHALARTSPSLAPRSAATRYSDIIYAQHSRDRTSIYAKHIYHIVWDAEWRQHPPLATNRFDLMCSRCSFMPILMRCEYLREEHAASQHSHSLCWCLRLAFVSFCDRRWRDIAPHQPSVSSCWVMNEITRNKINWGQSDASPILRCQIEWLSPSSCSLNYGVARMTCISHSQHHAD